MRYFIHLAYDGTRYHGWQIQPNGISVEGEIERCLSVLLREPVDIVGAGRTDAGVHARHMVAHFDFGPIDEAQLTYRLNKILPPDITIYRIEVVSDDTHARFSATSRTYHYYISTQKSPFNRQYTWRTHYALDFELMNQAAAMLLQYKDFACFCKSHTDVKTTLCDVTEAQWIRTSDSEWYFRITANRFLRNMVRAVVGTLVEVGRHRMTLEDFRQVIEGKKRTMAGESMPGNALFLERVGYPNN
ncbi:MAG: tRNA pseudouridine(38-40) synthase TruA [Prevotella sp.]|nr:tRNA pseudouridine(38-40) synthase TruA [Candidatus Prevotella equi]